MLGAIYLLKALDATRMGELHLESYIISDFDHSVDSSMAMLISMSQGYGQRKVGPASQAPYGIQGMLNRSINLP